MRHLESPFYHTKEVVDAKIPFSLNTSIFTWNYLRMLLIIGNFMIIRVTSVEWTWLGSEWPHA